VPNWQVSDEISSEHRYTVLNVGDPDITSFTYHSPIRTKKQEVELAATGHPLILLLKLSSQGGCIAMEGSLVEQRVQTP